MTREEAKKEFWKEGGIFENRTCKNCKWFNKKTYECENKENEQEIGNYDNVDYISMQVDEDFGCNRFERKENEKN